ncbi:hypothetical protein Pla123a_43540 [Posidoniimonas polymericola]|uniref:Gene product 88 domain-containing protein n=1 Tax=Posidoniimonas polymericola TaxID=2528002 RepID=A0A5C5XYC5_9BACT|nr:hypothetical protein [Posidoniimonas polymericola]TWT66925.1 hypothetical protein Pla123a_43540 [Posidoniimonas polymericola]
MNLLRTNAKLAKAGPDNYLVAGLALAPHGLSGHQVCPASTVGCRAACNLWFSGQRVVPAARQRAIRDTQWLAEDRRGFLAQLHHDIAQHARRADRALLRPMVRLNVGSDLDWREVIERWPEVQFYDYTKVLSRFRAYLDGKLPPNYALTFSASERSHPATLASFLRRGGNVAAVFAVDYYPACGRIGPLPRSVRYWGAEWPVIDADKHDIRLPSVDGRGVVCGLRLKGTNAAKARGRATGFAAPC